MLIYAMSKSMKILNLGSPILVQDLRELGHQVFSVGLAGCSVNIQYPFTPGGLSKTLAAASFTPDCVLWIDNGCLPLTVGLEAMRCPSLFYSVDTFCNPWHIPFANAFDLVLVAQKGYVTLFPSTVSPEWLPLFCQKLPDDLSCENCLSQQERDIPVSFVGTLHPRNIPDRIIFLEEFKRRHPLVMLQGEYFPVFCRSSIVLNQTAVSEVNYRCFESMACGAALLTEESEDGLLDLFTPGVNILPPYQRGNAEQAAGIAKAWLSNPEKLRDISRAGFELVHKLHTARQRAEQIAKLLEDAVLGAIHRQRLAELAKRRILLSTAYAILAVELEKTLPAHKQHYLELFDSVAQHS